MLLARVSWIFLIVGFANGFVVPSKSQVAGPLKLSKLSDVFQPALYFLEKKVVSTMIPNVVTDPSRKRLVPSNGEKFDHSVWDAVLKQHVTPDGTIGDIRHVSLVDYAGIAQDANFDQYLKALATAEPDDLSEAEQLAFWINAYNALCVNVIVSHERNNGPLDSINELSTRKMAVWDQVAGTVGGVALSLNDIEHEKLRRVWDEPAIHGCIVCASASCPNLRPEAFVASKLSQQMEEQMKDWLSNPTKGLLVDENRVTLSRIFMWFERDFGGWSGIQAWVPQFVNEEAGRILKGDGLSKRYFVYNWSINRR